MRMRPLGNSPISSFYHVVSRVVDRRFVLGDGEREYLRKLLFQQAAFAGVEVVAWCFMSNHFHLLIEVPNKEAATAGWSDEDFINRLELLNSEKYTRQVLGQIRMWQGNGNAPAVHKAAMAVKERLFDLSMFVKELKFKFSVWFNKWHGRKGTLWEERFRSVLLEDGEAVRFCAAYIDLNPVRAGLCENPEDYRWCSYAAAMGGDVVSRRGLARAWGRTKWTSGVAREHRMLLFGRGEEVLGGETAWGGTAKAKGGFSRERIEEELKNGGRMPMWQVLRCRVRYFTEGGVLGSRAFVDGFFERERSRFGENRKSGARAMNGGEWGGVMALRDLGRKA
ncbi:MAG: transposase [Verrucomicrobiales bacterium]